MTLGEKQRAFARLVPRLIDKAHELGFEVTLGDAYRSPQQAAANAAAGTGIANSLHTLRLAIDLNLFRDGVYLTRSEDHKPLGDYWKTLHPLCSWGGDFVSRPDGCHYSLTHNGIR